MLNSCVVLISVKLCYTCACVHMCTLNVNLTMYAHMGMHRCILSLSVCLSLSLSVSLSVCLSLSLSLSSLSHSLSLFLSLSLSLSHTHTHMRTRAHTHTHTHPHKQARYSRERKYCNKMPGTIRSEILWKTQSVCVNIYVPRYISSLRSQPEHGHVREWAVPQPWVSPHCWTCVHPGHTLQCTAWYVLVLVYVSKTNLWMNLRCCALPSTLCMCVCVCVCVCVHMCVCICMWVCMCIC